MWRLPAVNSGFHVVDLQESLFSTGLIFFLTLNKYELFFNHPFTTFWRRQVPLLNVNILTDFSLIEKVCEKVGLQSKIKIHGPPLQQNSSFKQWKETISGSFKILPIYPYKSYTYLIYPYCPVGNNL